MLGRRPFLHATLAGTGCLVCAGLGAGALSGVAYAADAPELVQGPDYTLRFVGSQREAIMTGRREARLDLRTLRGVPHLCGLGPMEGLTGEVTILDGRPSLARVGPDGALHVEEAFDVGVPFFVWAEVAGWRTMPVPEAVRSYAELELFVGEAGRAAGLTQAFPFTVAGVPAQVAFHVVNAKPGTALPANMAAHAAEQVNYTLAGRQATLVGFWSAEHAGVFTPMDSRMHVHFQSAANDVSGHVDGLDLGSGGMTLGLPMPA